jgi:thiol-disulfide isomerase/thioredoxin
MRAGRYRALLALAAIASLALGPGATPASAYAQNDIMRPFFGATGWLNTAQPLTPESLRGKVVLVDFWEYTCINCLRTLPYLQEWYKRYHDDGLEIVGVHTPEFDFSAQPKNVAEATKHLGVTWPVALDPNYAVWKTYENQNWPHEFLFDRQGRLVDQVIGEGGYQETERAIQKLLRASHPGKAYPPPMALLPQDSYTKPGAVCYLGTAEVMVGPWKGQHVANVPPSDDGYHDTTDPDHHVDGQIYLNGNWQLDTDAAISGRDLGNQYLAMRYHAIQVVAVLRSHLGKVDVLVTQDGQPIPKADAASDVRYDGRGRSYITVDQPRAYELLKNRKFGSHDLRLYPQGQGVGVYSFDFESCEQGSDT